MTITFEAARSFIRVVDRASFSGAARDLALTQPTVSKHIAQLEAALGARLLSRSTHGVTPTEAGEIYFKACVHALSELDEARTLVAGARARVGGVLRVDLPVGFGSLHVLGHLPELLRRHPELRLDLSMRDQTVDLWSAGVDVAVRLGPILDERLVVRPVGVTHRWLVASPQYLAQRGVPRQPDELSDHACLSYAGTAGQGWVWTFRRGRRRAEVKFTPAVRSDNGLALRDLACSGAGVALLPDWLVRDAVVDGTLRRVLDGWVAPSSALSLVYPAHRFVPTKVRLFADYMAEKLAPLVS